jgi:iron complex outermembrane receptor protein
MKAQQRYRLKPMYLLVLQVLSCYAVAATPDTAVADAPAADAAATPAAPAAPAAAPVLVETFGRGQSRQVQNISRADLAKALPGTSPLKALEKLPGVSFQSADPFGIYEWSVRFSIRGFSQNQLGFTLDNIPLGDMSYGNNNGLFIGRALVTENLGRVAVSQGAGTLGTASTSNLGGTVQFFTLDPNDAMGTTFAQTFGSDKTSRTFARFDSGEFGSGTKLYISGTRQRTGKWKGDGSQDQDSFNSKIMYSFGDHVLSAFYNYSDRVERDYQDLSLSMIGRVAGGHDFDYYAPDWQRALNAANGIYSGGVNNKDDAYFAGTGVRKDGLGGLALALELPKGISLNTSLYHHSNKGQGHWYTPYASSSPTIPIAIRSSEYDISRHGVLSDLSFKAGMHEVRAGFWIERNHHIFLRNFYAITGPEDTDYFLSNPTTTAFKQDFNTRTNQFYVQDTMSMMDDKLKFNFGFKSTSVKIDTVSLIGTRAAGTIEAKKGFLPQFGALYRINRNDEIFASASKNMRAYQPGAVGPFSQTQAAFDAGKPNLKPETSTTVDLGYRFKRNMFQGSLALYRADFSDRQLNVATCSGIAGCPSTLVNVGKVGTKGVEAIIQVQPVKAITWFNSFTYNDSKYKEDYLDNGVTIPAGGKTVADTPRSMFASEATYDTGKWFVRLGTKYTARRYYTYLNDGGVPAYWLTSLGGGYKFSPNWQLQMHVTNVQDKQYFATIGSNGYTKTDAAGNFATLLSGSPTQFFVTLSGKL